MSTERNMAVLMDDMKDVMRDVDGLLKGIPKDLSEEGRKARRQLEETMDTAKLRYRQLEKRATQGLRVTDEWVHEKPYPVVGSAFGIGLLIGLLIGRRH